MRLWNTYIRSGILLFPFVQRTQFCYMAVNLSNSDSVKVLRHSRIARRQGFYLYPAHDPPSPTEYVLQRKRARLLNISMEPPATRGYFWGPGRQTFCSALARTYSSAITLILELSASGRASCLPRGYSGLESTSIALWWVIF